MSPWGEALADLFPPFCLSLDVVGVDGADIEALFFEEALLRGERISGLPRGVRFSNALSSIVTDRE